MAHKDKETIQRQVEKIAVDTLTSWVGERGEVLDTGESSGPDFEIRYRDGRSGIGEVGIHEDPVFAATIVAIEERQTPHAIALPNGYGSWAMSILRSAGIKDLERALPGLVRSLLDQGRFTLEITSNRPRDNESLLARSLGIAYLHRTEESGANYAFFAPSMFEGDLQPVPTDANRISTWIEEVLGSDEYQDSWMKLLPFEHDEKHVFIMTSSRTESGIDKLLERTGENMPNIAPNLPGDLTHIWIMGRYATAGLSGSVTYWSKSDGWTRMDE